MNEANWLDELPGITEPITPVPDVPPAEAPLPPPAVELVDNKQFVFSTSTEPWQTLTEPVAPTPSAPAMN